MLGAHITALKKHAGPRSVESFCGKKPKQKGSVFHPESGAARTSEDCQVYKNYGVDDREPGHRYSKTGSILHTGVLLAMSGDLSLTCSQL